MNQAAIKNYELTGSLGRGGFSSVFKARSTEGQVYALKVLNKSLTNNPQLVKLFLNEAAILSRLEHKNICRLIECFSNGPEHVIVLEFIEGADLRELMQAQSPVPFKQAKDIACDCLAALQYAYEKGILHRDIKPSNIMIDRAGRTVLMDFGTSVAFSEIIPNNTGRIISAAYCAPERFNGPDRHDIRSDIYSLGMVFYELFTGRLPFNREDIPDITAWHLKEVPLPADACNPSLSPEISGAIKTALEKRPEDRFTDFNAFKTALGL
ncbi:MAG: serine/threonine protein kinase [Deltaproteobacteria bacterium]|jgi:serine/threonine-protein kinase|nr:serine/threonine protein kinase [Deltaproteobacteria bacterium]